MVSPEGQEFWQDETRGIMVCGRGGVVVKRNEE